MGEEKTVSPFPRYQYQKPLLPVLSPAWLLPIFALVTANKFGRALAFMCTSGVKLAFNLLIVRKYT